MVISTPMEEREYELELSNAMAWERDALHRLYYPLWILFMGGFVLSLRVPFHWYICLNTVLLVPFRVLSVLGTGLNFLAQQVDITGVSCSRWAYVYASTGHPDIAKEKYEEAKRSAQVAITLTTWLLRVAFLFLVIALVGSFLIRLS